MSDFLYKIGDLIIIEMGEYSDHTWDDPVRVLKPFSRTDVSAMFRSYSATLKRDYEWEDECQASDFLPWLVKEGYVEAVENVHRWHVGSYGDFEP